MWLPTIIVQTRCYMVNNIIYLHSLFIDDIYSVLQIEKCDLFAGDFFPTLAGMIPQPQPYNADGGGHSRYPGGLFGVRAMQYQTWMVR